MESGSTVESEGSIALGDVDMYYKERGVGQPVVLVHAGIADGRMWDPQLERLSTRYRVIVPDLRGFGHTPMVESPFSHADDLATLCAALGIERTVFVGASMGGTAVIDLALAEPDLVSCFVSIGGDPSGYEMTDTETIAGWARANEAFERGDLREAARIESEMWFVGQGREPASVDSDLLGLVVEMLLRSYESADGEEVGPDQPAVGNLKSITQDALLIIGEFDRADMISAAEMLVREIPGASLRRMDDAAHLPSLESPERVTPMIEEFLERVYGCAGIRANA
jgi:pimeloyl-ACP methyl ester carboxylesterase